MNENNTLKTTTLLESLIPLMEAKGVTVEAREFHQAVNLLFHKHESLVYDSLHQEMWQSLPQQFGLLANDLLQHGRPLPESLTLLDIGCGTGLSTELLLHTPLGKRITQVDLLDTSPEMLNRCRARAQKWGIPHHLIEGQVESIQEKQYGLILTCSVLHHIPDLAAFLQTISRRQEAGGAYLLNPA